MMLTNLAGVLRDAGLKVREEPGWKSHGHGGFTEVRGVLWHHTAGAASGNFPSLGVVRDGRAGLAGPLCNLGLARDGTWHVIAAGLAYHAGRGYYQGIPRNNGNHYLIGVEAENTGTGQPWPPAQIDAYRRGTAALLAAYGLGADRAIGHKEYAPSRKIDPYGLDMNAERGHVAHYMRSGSSAPGGIEEMAFNDSFKDWANNDQTVHSWMNHVDRRLFELHRAILGLQQSRIPGDKNTTNVANAVMDSTAWTAQIMGMVAALRGQAGVDPDEVAESLKPVIGPVVSEAVSAAVGRDNGEQADAIVDEITKRLSGEDA